MQEDKRGLQVGMRLHIPLRPPQKSSAGIGSGEDGGGGGGGLGGKTAQFSYSFVYSEQSSPVSCRQNADLRSDNPHISHVTPQPSPWHSLSFSHYEQSTLQLFYWNNQGYLKKQKNKSG